MLILGWISEGVIGAGLWIITGVYKVAAFVFELFLILATGELLREDAYKTMITNFYVILGIVMLFIVAFALLQSMIKPDDQNKGASSIKKIIVNIITSAIIMAVLPTIFTFAYDFQESFINEYNVIGRFFGYGDIGTEKPDNGGIENIEKVKRGAYRIVNGVYTAFFNVNPDKCKSQYEIDVVGNDTLLLCQGKYDANEAQNYETTGDGTHSFAQTIAEVDATGKFGYYTDFVEHADSEAIDFNFLLALAAGCLLVYVGISYCFDMAVRLVKLVFYQLIAPIPIFFRIVPEGKLNGTFNQWLKVTITCYLEVFVRIFVFYFCVYLCVEMLDSEFLSENVYKFGIFQGLFAKAFVLMGVVTFLKSAPKLIGDITGMDSGNMKIGIKEKLASGGAFVAGSAMGAGISSLVRGTGNSIRLAKENWKSTENLSGKAKAKAISSNAKLVTGGIASTARRTASGTFAGFRGGLNAKDYKGMSTATTEAIAKAKKKEEQKLSYKANHSTIGKYDGFGSGILGEGWGHIKDLGRSVAAWAGYQNEQELKDENALLSQLLSERKAVETAAFDVIDGDLAKSKTSVSYVSDSDWDDLRNLKGKYDDALAGHGGDTKLTKEAFDKARKKMAEDIQKIALLGINEWQAQGSAVQVDLSAVRENANKLRTTATNNITSSVMNLMPEDDRKILADRTKGLNFEKNFLYDGTVEMVVGKDSSGRDIIEKVKMKDAAKIITTRNKEILDQITADNASSGKDK